MKICSPIPLLAALLCAQVSLFAQDAGTLDASFAPEVLPLEAGTPDAGFAPDLGSLVAGTLDTGFNPNAGGQVLGLAVQPDAKIVFEGSFGTIGGMTRLRSARVNADGTLDTGFNPSLGGAFGWCTAILPDGKTVIGGEFTTVGGVARNYIARLNADNTLDTAFNPNANATVKCIALQADGKFVIGGDFTTVGGVTRNRIARLNADGTLDTAFNPNASGVVNSVLVQADGKIVLAGGFTTVGAGTHNRVARVNADGTLDAFAPDVNSAVFSAALQADGKILIGGNFTTVGGTARNRLARLNTNGVLDSAFNPNVNNLVYSMAVQADGRIVIGGDFTTVGGVAHGRIARVNADGTTDAAFVPTAETTVDGTALQADGSILLCGDFVTVNGVTRSRIARLANDAPTQALTVSASSRVQWLRGGTAPEAELVTFEASTDGGVSWSLLGTGTRITGGWEGTSLNVPPSGSIRARARTRGGYVNGSTGLVEQIAAFSLPPASVDGGFAMPQSPFAHGIAVQPDGKIAIANHASGAFPQYCFRVKTDGTLDLIFSPSANDLGMCAAVQADGKVLFGGEFTSPGYKLVRYNAAGTLDAGFSATASLAVYWLAPQPDGKIVTGGNFNTMNGVNRFKVARLNADGSLDTTFGNPSVLAQVWSGALQPDGKIVIGGSFDSVGGAARNYIARLNANGTVDASFNPNANNVIYTVALQADGKIIIAGDFTAVGGVTRNRMARLNTDGTLDAGFNPNLDALVQSTVVQADGKILIGGNFTTVGGVARKSLARLTTTGALDTAFDIGAINGVVVSAALQADGKIVMGGNFTTINGSSRQSFARILNDPATLSLTVPGASRVEWLRGGSAPESQAVSFELSTDGGTNWTLLGAGVRITGGWEITALNLPASGLIRARARTAGGYFNGSSGLVEQVQTFGAPQAVVATGGASAITPTTATVAGTANPGGWPTTASFDYNTSPTLAGTVANAAVTVPPGSGTAAVAVSAALTGLSPLTTYYYRVKAVNAAGTVSDGIQSFATPATPPTVLTQAATGVAQTTANLNGAVNPNGFATTATFSYSTSPTLATGVVTVNVTTQPGSGTGAVAVAAAVTGLAPDTTYYFRVGAANAGGAVTDGILSFATPPYPLPTVVTQAATQLGFTSARLNGAVNPNGFSTTASFDYSTSPTLATGVQTVNMLTPPGSGTSPVDAKADLTGLAPGVTYYFRLKAANIGGPAQDGILSFTTPIPPPTVATLAATAVIPIGAVLNGTVNPNGFATTASFDYNTSPTLAGTVTNVPVASAPGSGTAAVAVSAALTGLTPGMPYYFRLKAVNAGGTTQDGIVSFTPPLPPHPSVQTGGATQITQNSATIANGIVNPNGGPTTVQIRYRTSLPLSDAPALPIPLANTAGTAPETVSGTLAGLQPNTLYYYQMEATNAGGTEKGDTGSFATLPLPPVVTTLSASAIGFTSAVLNGLVKGNGAATTYGFDWGAGAALDQATPGQSLGNVNSTQVVSASLSGLALNTDYSFRVRATNGGGTVTGSTLTFSTPPLTVGGDGRYTLVAGKTWTLGQEFIIPGDLIVEGTLVPNGWKLTVLGTVTVRPAGAITNPNGKVRAFFRDGSGAAGVVSDLAALETLATLGLVGQQPMAALLDGGDGWMYGTTASGGKSAQGTVFRLRRTGEAEVLGNFTGPDGAVPQSALVGSAATGIYGTTTLGGTLGRGTVFRVTPPGGIVKLADFDGTNGRAPSGGLTAGPDGLLYGVASRGGVIDRGTLFRVTLGGAIEKLADFTGPNGAIPQAALTLGSDGIFYGATTYGGTGFTGLVFRYDKVNGLLPLASLTGPVGAYPMGALIEGAPGVFYGTCYGGGAEGKGTVFRFGSGQEPGLGAGGLALLASFTLALGEGPIGPLARGADGNFYGTTYTGVSDCGAVFKVTDGGALTRLTPVIGNAGTGAHPGAGLLRGTDGAWYGVSQDGGTAARGAVFRVLLTGVMENVASFTDSVLPSGLTVGPVDGQLYGTTQRGGSIGWGSVFAYAPRTPPVTLASFTPGYGQEPQAGAGALFGVDGTTLYGTAALGALGKGVVWKLPAGGALAALVSFNGVNGSGPLGGLVPSGDGGFFGTTAALGNVFKVTPAGVLTPQGLVANGAAPQAALVADGAGAFYGTTRAGGTAGQGTVYKLTPGGGVAVVADFTGANGGEPLAPLLRLTGAAAAFSADPKDVVSASAVSFAGSTLSGGANGLGTLFMVTSGGTVTPLFGFTGVEGQAPRGPLLGSGDGGFFGTASGGGAFGKGTVFRLGALGTMQVIAHLTGDNDGASPGTGLTAAADGYLYGSTDATLFRVPYGPSVTTLAATGFTPVQTTLRGELLPRGLATTATFEWGTTPALGNTLAAGNSSSTSAVPVSATLPLAGGATYYYRVKATNVMGVKQGSVIKFKTPALVASAGGFTLPAGTTWTLPGDYTIAGNLTVFGTLDTAGQSLTVQGKLTLNALILNATGMISFLDRAGGLPPGAIRLLGDAAHDLADPDLDTYSNLLEFALGSNPGVFSQNVLPVPAMAGGFLTLTYHTPVGIGGVQVIVEVSNDLANWFSGPGFTAATSDTIANGVRTVSVRDDQGGAMQYMRLRVTR